jgi:hypothetical protein
MSATVRHDGDGGMLIRLGPLTHAAAWRTIER